MTARLNRGTPVPAGVGADLRPERAGIVHLGIGAFHRAHQAVYTQDAMRASGERDWGIVGVTQRSADVADRLLPQGGRYGVLTVDGDDRRLDLVGAVLDVLVPSRDTPSILAAIADPGVHVVTVTVTERGYPVGPGGGLDTAAVASDLAALAREEAGAPLGADPATSMPGMLVRGLAARRRAGAGPVTVISCDNLDGNGRLLARLVADAAAGTPGLADWIAANTAFPSTMVDRIVPAATPAWLEAGAALLGADDAGLVVGEPARMWAIEDRFAGPRPPWELAGALVVADVAPFERAKLRMLNAAHSLIAYLGGAHGHATIADAVADPAIAATARTYLLEEAAPALLDDPADAAGFAAVGLDLQEYADDLLVRFGNTALGHSVHQVAADGTLKLTQRWLPVLRQRLAAGVVPQALAAGVDAWGEYLAVRVAAGERIADPRADALAALVAPGGAAAPDAEPGPRAAALLDALGFPQHPGLVAAVARGGAARQLSKR